MAVAHLFHACVHLEELNGFVTKPILQAGKIKVDLEVSISKLVPILCLDCFSNPFIGKTQNVERIAGLFARVDNVAPKGLYGTGGQLRNPAPEVLQLSLTLSSSKRMRKFKMIRTLVWNRSKDQICCPLSDQSLILQACLKS